MSYIEFKYTISNFNASSDHLELKFEMINSYDRDLYFSRRGTPFDSYLCDCFIIKHNNDVSLKFDGLLVTRIEESGEDILTLKSGETLETTLKISTFYKFYHTGNYEIQFNIDNFRFLLETKVAINNLATYYKPIIIVNKPHFFSIDIKSFLFKTIGDKYREDDKIKEDTGIRFSCNATDKEKDILRRITDELITFYTKHEQNSEIQIYDDVFYKRWFGSKFATNNRKVIDTLSFTFKKIKEKNILYCIDNSCISYCDYAYTVDGSKRITILPPFWQALDDKSFYSKSVIILHEFTHVVGLTNHYIESNVCNGLKLAINDCDKAILSPYSYQYYIADLMCKPSLPQNC